MFVCCECCVLSGRGLCDELITRPEESYRQWCVVECDLETSRIRRSWPTLGHSATGKKSYSLKKAVDRRNTQHTVLYHYTQSVRFMTENKQQLSSGRDMIRVGSFLVCGELFDVKPLLTNHNRHF